MHKKALTINIKGNFEKSDYKIKNSYSAKDNIETKKTSHKFSIFI